MFPIQTVLYIELNLFSLAVLFLILWNISRRMDKGLPEQRLFLALLFCTALALLLDTVLYILEGKTDFWVRPVLRIAAAFSYSVGPVVFAVWLCYVDYQIFRHSFRRRKLLAAMFFPACCNAVFSLLSLWTGSLFYFDADNLYHRGPFFLAAALIDGLYLLCAGALVLLKRGRIQARMIPPLFLFILPPLLGGSLQLLFRGPSVLWVCITVSILILFINMQNYQLYTDYLTGVFNRRELDHFLQRQMQGNIDKRLLAGLMIDLNSFKLINDRFGHDVGDEALQHLARILKQTFRKRDFIARYGGDEFVILMNLKSGSDAARAVRRLKENVNRFNEKKIAPYRLSLSIGFDTYTPMPGFTVHDFLRHIDGLMYEEKEKSGGRFHPFATQEAPYNP